MSLFDSLQAAALCAVRQEGFDLSEIVLERWATTYRCSVDQVEQALKIAQNGSRKLPEEVSASAPPSIKQEETEE